MSTIVKNTDSNKNLVSFRLNPKNTVYINNNGLREGLLPIFLNKAIEFYILWVTRPKDFLCKIRAVRPELYKGVGRIQFLEQYIKKWLN